MRITTGVDIIEVNRIKKAIEELQERFLNRIYTEYEIEYCYKFNKMMYQHFAARFAAKEAVFKALSEYIETRDDLLWKQIEVICNKDGRPMINTEKLNLIGLSSIDISISHIQYFAVASVVAVFNDDRDRR